MRGLHLLISLFPAAVLALAGAGIVAFLLAGPHPSGVTRAALFAVAATAGIVFAGATWGAVAATRRVRGQLAALRSASVRSQADLLLLAERVQQGERPVLRTPDPVPGAPGDPFAVLARDLQQERHAAREALLQVAVRMSGGSPDHRTGVSASLATRMQALVQEETQLLGQLKSQVWDPAVLESLLAVDHLAARTRRHLESLAVVAGAGPLRQWRQSTTVHDVLQAAAAEVEHPGRVTVVPPAYAAVRAGAAADVVHMVAELIDNATRYSPVQARTLVRADVVTAGLAIEVEDRGASLGASERHRINTLLSHPNRAEARQLLSGGRTGMFVVSELARRHGIEVQLQGNIYGGTQAVVVLPQELLESGATDPGLPGVPLAEPLADAPAEPGPDTPAAPVGETAAPAVTEPAIAGPAADTEPAVPPEVAGQPAAPEEFPVLHTNGSQPYPAPPPRDEPPASREEPIADRIADLMAAFRNPAGGSSPEK